MGFRANRLRYLTAVVADAAALRLSSWTVECCVRIETAPATDEVYPLIAKGGLDNTTRAPYYVSYRDSSGTKQIHVGYVDTGGTSRTLQHAYTLVPGRWYNIAASFDNATDVLNIYVVARQSRSSATPTTYGGVAATTTYAATAPHAGTESLRFGFDCAADGSLSSGANASLSEIRIYSSALSSATLDSRLNERLVGTESTLVGYWRCDEGSGGIGGTTLYDRASGTGRNATIQTGAPHWTDDPPDLWYDTGAILTTGGLGWGSGIRLPATVITASDENASYPASNLRCARQATYTRTANATGAKTWTIDFGAPRPVAAVTIDNHNLSSGAVITVAMNASDAWGGPDVSETVTYHPGRIRHLMQRPWHYRYLRLSITDANASGGYIQLGTLEPWIVWEAPHGIDPAGQAWAVEDVSSRVETPHGHGVGRDISPVRRATLSLSGLRRNQTRELRRILRLVGGGPVWACADFRRGLYARSAYGYLEGVAGDSPAERSSTFGAVSGLTVVEDRA